MLRLIRDQVGIEPIFEDDFSNSKLIITPDIAKRRCTQGIVKQLGPEVKDIKIGDYCIFSPYSGTIVAIGDELILILEEEGVDARYECDVMLNLEEKFTTVSYTKVMKEIAHQLSSHLLKVKYPENRHKPDKPLKVNHR